MFEELWSGAVLRSRIAVRRKDDGDQAFAAADEKDALGGSKVRTIYSSVLSRDGDLLRYRVRGSGFLKHMVRNIVGGLIEVGRGNMTAEDLHALLLAGPQSRKLGHAAPGRGLFLLGVEYQR